ncbi:hypothetical protein WK78_04630 [Burkholderia cepacia]|nr:hypothetical protein WI25_31155 [Burkholderia cepacia]KVV31795.1 hypothetical protein WK78_04630 [Burkholderia cepacia]
MAIRLAALRRLLLDLFFGNANHKFFRLRERNHLFNGKKKVVAIFERSRSKALNKHVVLKQPQDSRRNFFAKLRGDHDESLVIPWIKYDLREFLFPEKFANPCFRVLTSAIFI